MFDKISGYIGKNTLKVAENNTYIQLKVVYVAL